jgi:hypothetical protein
MISTSFWNFSPAVESVFIFGGAISPNVTQGAQRARRRFNGCSSGLTCQRGRRRKASARAPAPSKTSEPGSGLTKKIPD